MWEAGFTEAGSFAVGPVDGRGVVAVAWARVPSPVSPGADCCHQVVFAVTGAGTTGPMPTSKNDPRRRCTSCRKWFRPAPSARATQRTCSEACRRVRQRRLARQRRERELHEYRVDERERQRASRERRRARAGSTSPSRAPLPEQLLLLKEELLTLWDEQARRSRATLARRLHRLLRRWARP